MGPAAGGLEVDAARHHLRLVGDEDILEQQGARHRPTHAEGVPVADDAQAGRVSRHRHVQRVPHRQLGLGLRAKHAVVVRRAGQRGEDLLAVDAPAAADARRSGAERRPSGGGGAAFGKRLRVDRPVPDHSLIVDRAVPVVLGALRGRHVEVVGQGAGPQHRAGVHVVGEGGGAAVLAEGSRDDRIGPEVGAAAAEFLRHAKPEQAACPQIGIVLVRKARLAIVALGALSETRPKRFHELDQGQLPGVQRVGRTDHRVAWIAHRAMDSIRNSSGVTRAAFPPAPRRRRRAPRCSGAGAGRNGRGYGGRRPRWRRWSRGNSRRTRAAPFR